MNHLQELGHIAADGIRRHTFGVSLGVTVVVASVVAPRIQLWPAGLEQELSDEAAVESVRVEAGMPEAEVRRRLGAPFEEETLPKPSVVAAAAARKRLSFEAVEGWTKEVYLDGDGRLVEVRYSRTTDATGH